MWLPTTYAAALGLMLLSMAAWGSWDNTQKLARWRFELFYWDYMWGIVAAAVLLGLALGNLHTLAAASGRALAWAFFGGVVWNLGNLLLVAAISIAGMAVAFPVGSGLALVIGGVLNYFIEPAGSPVWLFGGIALVCGAIAADAFAYRALERQRGHAGGGGGKGVVLSLICGVVLGLFYPLVAKAMKGPGALGPYAVLLVFVLGALASNFCFNGWMMRHPVNGKPVGWHDYGQGRAGTHAWGVMGGLIWGVGTMASYVAASVPLVGPAASFSMAQGNTLISALWGVVVWKEFRGGGTAVGRWLTLMFALFVLGLIAIALAPLRGTRW
ncbi:MAG: GRP family sugar transporter [Terriglobales bacterium]